MVNFKVKNDQSIQKVNELVIDFLVQNPPTLGHGYSHFVKVAENCLKIGQQNNFDDLNLAYVCGLLHDLYRPAEGKAGQESHESRTAQFAKKLIKKTNFEKSADLIAQTIDNHDQKILDRRGTNLMETLSLADKADMSFQRAVAYCWASNQNLLKLNKKPAYSSFLEAKRDFCYFQSKSWKIFTSTKVKGVKQAAKAYLATDKKLNSAVKNELSGKINFNIEVINQANLEAEQELKYLKKAGCNQNQVKEICKNFKIFVQPRNR